MCDETAQKAVALTELLQRIDGATIKQTKVASIAGDFDFSCVCKHSIKHVRARTLKKGIFATSALSVHDFVSFLPFFNEFDTDMWGVL